jgi:hypothetical protein
MGALHLRALHLGALGNRTGGHSLRHLTQRIGSHAASSNANSNANSNDRGDTDDAAPSHGM